MNKKVLLSVFTALCCNTVSQAQEKGTSDLSVSVGGATSTELSNLFTDVLAEVLTDGGIYARDLKSGPTFGLTYRYAVADRLMVHADVFYQKMSQDIYVGDTKNGHLDYTYLTFGLGADYRYISKSMFQMYSGVAVAYSSESIKSSSSAKAPDGTGFFNYHVTAAGFRVGKTLAFFGEVGFGYKGIASAGLSYQF